VTSIELPDGTKLTFGEASLQQDTPEQIIDQL
jgi:hypothetical protein